MNLKLILVFISAVLLVQGQVPPKYKNNDRAPRRVDVEINGETFVFGLDEYVTFFGAEQICNNLGMRLLTLEAEDRWDMIKNFIYDNSVYDYWWWTSGRKPENSLDWSWSTTGTPFTYTAWYPSEPSNNELTDDSCLQLNAGNQFGTTSGWDDARCLDAFTPYICEPIPA